MVDEKRSVELAIDNSKALKALEELRKKEVDIAKAQAKGTITANKAAKSIQKVEKERRDLIKVNRVLDDSFGREEKQIRDTTKAVQSQAQSFGELADARRKQIDEAGAGFAGDVAGQAAGLRGAAGTFGGEALAPAFEVGEAFADVAEFGPQAAASMRSIGEGIGTVAKTGTGLVGSLAAVATASGGTIAGLTGTSVAMGTVAAVALPLVAISASLALAFKLASDAAADNKVAIENQAAANRELNDLLFSGAGTDEAIAAARASQTTFEIAKANLADAETAYAEYIESNGNVLTKFIDGTEDALFAEIETAQAAFLVAGTNANTLAQAAVDGTFAANDAVIAEENLAETRAENATQLQAELAATEQRANQAIQAELAIGQRIVDAQASRTQAQADADEFAVLEAEIANGVQAEQESEHRDNLARIASEGQDNLENLRSEFVKLASARGQALTDVDAKGNDKLSTLRDGFFGKQIKSTQKFQRETEKIETDTAKKRTKLLADLNDRLSDAARDNNVIAFLEAQRDGNKALADEAINAQDAEKQRVAEFTRQREDERQVFEAKQAETLAAIQFEKAAVVEAFNERRAALAESVRAEKLAIETRLQAEEQRFAAQELREKITADRQARRDEIRARHEQRDFDASITRLRNEANLKQQIHQQEMTALQAIQQQIANLQTTASRSTSGSSRQSSSFLNAASRFGQRRPNSGAANRRFQAFHEGGVIDFAGGQSEGFALVKQGEVVINPDSLALKGGQGLPLSSSNALGGGLGQSINVTVQDNRTVQIGDIATVSDVESALRTSNEAIVTNIHSMIEGATA